MKEEADLNKEKETFRHNAILMAKSSSPKAISTKGKQSLK